MRGVYDEGINIETILADAGYCSKNNYAICKELGIFNSYINFKSNVGTYRSKSDLWREKVREWKNNPELGYHWRNCKVICKECHEIFSSAQRKANGIQ